MALTAIATVSPSASTMTGSPGRPERSAAMVAGPLSSSHGPALVEAEIGCQPLSKGAHAKKKHPMFHGCFAILNSPRTAVQERPSVLALGTAGARATTKEPRPEAPLRLRHLLHNNPLLITTRFDGHDVILTKLVSKTLTVSSKN